ncbi:hypothetical protein M1N51_01260 [Peptococcaceae bacterium]|nr:hypothetical protein [Peptococcaceae bacterium]
MPQRLPQNSRKACPDYSSNPEKEGIDCPNTMSAERGFIVRFTSFKGVNDKSASKIKARPIIVLWSNAIDMSPIAIEEMIRTLRKPIHKPSPCFDNFFPTFL